MKNIGIISPNKVGPYYLHNVIGEGAYSVVRLAIHEVTKQKYACKIVPKRRLDKEYSEEMFKREVRILMLMRHPNIAFFHEFHQDTLNFYITLELVVCGSLYDMILRKGKLGEAMAKHVFRQIIEAVHYLHSNNVAHRDIKLENILVSDSYKVKLIDFGLSQFFSENHLMMTPCGSPSYVSPEIAENLPYDGLKSDVWSCGVVLYFLVYGVSPWTSQKTSIILSQIRNAEYFTPPTVSKECTDLIHLMMCKDTSRRISVGEILNSNWLKQQYMQEIIEEISQVVDVSKSQEDWREMFINRFQEIPIPMSQCDDSDLPNAKRLLAIAHRRRHRLRRRSIIIGEGNTSSKITTSMRIAISTFNEYFPMLEGYTNG